MDEIDERGSTQTRDTAEQDAEKAHIERAQLRGMLHPALRLSELRVGNRRPVIVNAMFFYQSI